MQDIGGERDKWRTVWGYLSPLSIKGKQCDRGDTAGESRPDPFAMKEETG